MLGNTETTSAGILRDVGFASTDPVVRNIRAPLEIIREVPAKTPHSLPLCLSKEKVSSNVSLLNLMQFTRDLAQHTRPVVPVICDENIHYRICKMMYAEKTRGEMSANFCGSTLHLANLQILCYTNISLVSANSDFFP